MPISSLNKFSVKPATSAINQPLLMPKLQYRFRVTMVNFGVGQVPTTELTKQVMMVDRPKPEFEEIQLDVYNSTVKLAGNHKFSDIKLKLRDDITNQVTTKVGQQMQKQFDFFEQSSAVSGSDYKFTMFIEILDGGNGAYNTNVLETFEVQGCWIKGVTYDGGDYSKATDPMTMELTICYDNAIQTDLAGNPVALGGPVGRTFGVLAVGS